MPQKGVDAAQLGRDSRKEKRKGRPSGTETTKTKNAQKNVEEDVARAGKRKHQHLAAKMKQARKLDLKSETKQRDAEAAGLHKNGKGAGKTGGEKGSMSRNSIPKNKSVCAEEKT